MAKLKIVVIIIVLAFIIAMLGMAFYVSIQFSHVKITPPVPPVHLSTSLSAYVSYQDVLDYNNALDIMPYALISYDAANISSLRFNATLLSEPFPSRIYVLNSTQDCVNCGNMSDLVPYLHSYLAAYGLNSLFPNITEINNSAIPNVSRNSILIVPNGLMPSVFFQTYKGNSTLMHYLLGQGTSIIYIGQSFSQVVLPDGVIIPNSRIPGYLLEGPAPIYTGNVFYFNAPTFGFSFGNNFASASYVNYLNGSVVAFSNYPDIWKNTSDIAHDIAKSISIGFWLPRYAYGTENVSMNSSVRNIASEGIFLNDPKINYSSSNIHNMMSGILRTVVYTNRTYDTGVGEKYYYVESKPSYMYNGTISLQNSITPGTPAYITMEVFTDSSVPISIQPHLSIYNSNMSRVNTISLPLLSAVGNYTFVKYLKPVLAPGDYIISLKSFSDNLYASALFNVPGINITAPYLNYTADAYTFRVASAGLPVSGVNYSISLNGKYTVNGTLTNGTVFYALPKGTPEQFGTLNYTFSMLSTKFSYVASNPAPVIRITGKEIALAIVIIIVLVMVTMIRAPNRDEFYIDVQHLPSQKKTEITLKPLEVLATFSKLNMYYHWKYMPLSKAEVKLAIASNVRSNGIPVNLTMSNIEVLLDQLVSHGDLVTIGDLYAPKEWIQQGGHDIEYLAVFKLLRLYMVTNAYVFTDLDASPSSDMAVVVHGIKNNIVIYAPSSKFKNIPVYANSKTYIAFLNDDALEDFKDKLYSTSGAGAEQLKLYISSGYVKLVSMENPENLLG